MSYNNGLLSSVRNGVASWRRDALIRNGRGIFFERNRDNPGLFNLRA